MGCGACGSSGILYGKASARNRVSSPRVRGYSGSGVIKSQKRLALEAANRKAANPSTPKEDVSK